MATRKKTKKQTSLLKPSPETKNILLGVFFVTIALVAFFSTNVPTNGEMPIVGKYLQKAGIFLFGEAFRMIFSPILFLFGAMLLFGRAEWNNLKIFGIFGFFVSCTSLLGWFEKEKKQDIFFNIYSSLENVLWPEVTFLFLVALFLLSLYIVFQVSYGKILKKMQHHTKEMISQMQIDKSFDDEDVVKKLRIPASRKINTESLDKELEEVRKRKISNTEDNAPLGAKILGKVLKNSLKNNENPEEEVVTPSVKRPPFFEKKYTEYEKHIPIHDANGNKIEHKENDKTNSDKNSENLSTEGKVLSGWKFPALNLLFTPKKHSPISANEIREKALIIQKTLLQFGIEVKMEGECVWPTVIQYRLSPAEGVKVSRIENLNKDLALALSAKSIRIEAPIPGMNLVGIEVPNDRRDTINIREILQSNDFQYASKMALPVALGKDINGKYIIEDLAKMPHALVAGQTGSGKSVGMNGLILSLLYKKSPAELQMIMVDPKQVELGMYDGIPHLLTPVITDSDKALNALKWTVAEMERRYSIMKQTRTKNIIEYNDRIEKKSKIPYIVFIIDELADLMQTGNKKEAEIQISRIAQKGRAAGMHIIIATQRPSVDVITGLIKANIPSRMAFTVTSQVDSRTILDSAGAENLLGRGDMLYLGNGAMNLVRVQGMYVDTEEIDNVVREIRLTVIDEDWEPNIPDRDSVVREPSGNNTGSIRDGAQHNESEEIINKAIELVRSEGKCSTSMLQRHMNLGYGRAARVVDILEEMWVVWPANGSRPRDVLI